MNDPSEKLRRFTQIVRVGVIALALCAYALAAFLWMREQPASALIVAIFGYVVLRSRRAVVLSLTSRRYASRPEFAAALSEFEEDNETPSRKAPMADDKRERKTT